MDEIDKFMKIWEEKAVVYYTDLNRQFQKVKKEHQKDKNQYKKDHGLSVEYGTVPNSMAMQHYKSEMDFLRITVSNLTMENLIRFDGHASKFKSRLLQYVKKESDRKKKNLLKRIEKRTGEITKASLNIGANSELNGIIEGNKGKIKIETIYAGGYNIQCLHFRMLIHDL